MVELLRTKLVLASGSPRRREILTALGIAYEVVVTDIDETRKAEEEPLKYAERLAFEKAVSGCLNQTTQSVFSLGADTMVVCEDQLFGKPVNTQHAREMLRALSGKVHQVITAVALVHSSSERVWKSVQSTDVQFRPLSEDTIERYVATGEGNDKAGAYAIQGIASALVIKIHGSYSNVVGLPAAETVDMLLEAGVISHWP